MAHPSPDVAGDVAEPQRMVQRQCHCARAGGGEGATPKTIWRGSPWAVQLGFVAGTLIIAFTNLADLANTRTLFAVCSIMAGVVNVALYSCRKTSPTPCPADSRGRLPWRGIPAGDEDNCGLV